jgi:pimeloyl-ACP methyl ester carboxylesterase
MIWTTYLLAVSLLLAPSMNGDTQAVCESLEKSQQSLALDLVWIDVEASVPRARLPVTERLSRLFEGASVNLRWSAREPDDDIEAGTIAVILLPAPSGLAGPEHPGTFASSATDVYRLSTAESLFPVWDRSIPLEDKSAWRDPDVAAAYAREALASDPTSGSRTPPSFRAPSGALEDSFYQAAGRQLWDASMIRSAVLVIQSENDFWSRPEDRETLRAHLTSAPSVRVVVLPGATHFAHLDRPERGRSLFLDEVISFLAPAATSP